MLKISLLFRNLQTSWTNNSRIRSNKNAKFSGYCFYLNTNIYGDIQICISVPLMHFGFALELSNIDLWNIDLLDTHLDLLDKDIPSVLFVFIMSSRHLQDKPSRRLQRNNFSSSKRSWRRLARCLQDVFKTSLQDIFKTSSRGL